MAKCQFCEQNKILLIIDQNNTWNLDYINNFQVATRWNVPKPNFTKFNFCPVCGKEIKK